MMKLVFAVLSLLFISQHSFAKACDSQAISSALKVHQNSGLVDPYMLSYYEVVGRSVEDNSLFTVVRFIDSNYSTFYTVEQNPKNCKVIRVQ